MAIGSINNLDFALNAAKNVRSSSSASERVALILIADECSSGGAIIDLNLLMKQIDRNSIGVTHRDLLLLGQYGLLNVSDNYDGRCFCALPIATATEVSQARKQLKCDWPFVRGPGTDD
ncbi:hypothetical protein [Brucella pseudogrignonensis]|uniref:hypothetical protein n=1 Tax=Brucella pseudogrignonensis TaxID=419475 RepID=UPI0011B09B3A|nr:hypothetical protein [Brucella pseudogrignonensis]MQP38636.1 hypothetical protein [Ochrobactrum sp. MYb237]